jgi:hypothetical protein
VTGRRDDTPADAINHGWGGYKRGCRCETCRAGNTAMHRASQARRIARNASAQFEHGASGYKNWGCRCEICTTANTVACRPAKQRYRARRRAFRQEQPAVPSPAPGDRR